MESVKDDKGEEPKSEIERMESMKDDKGEEPKIERIESMKDDKGEEHKPRMGGRRGRMENGSMRPRNEVEDRIWRFLEDTSNMDQVVRRKKRKKDKSNNNKQDRNNNQILRFVNFAN